MMGSDGVGTGPGGLWGSSRCRRRRGLPELGLGWWCAGAGAGAGAAMGDGGRDAWGSAVSDVSVRGAADGVSPTRGALRWGGDVGSTPFSDGISTTAGSFDVLLPTSNLKTRQTRFNSR